MTFRTIICLVAAALGCIGAFTYIRRAKQIGIRSEDFRLIEFMKNNASLEKNSGINLLVFGVFAAVSSLALILKAFAIW